MEQLLTFAVGLTVLVIEFVGEYWLPIMLSLIIFLLWAAVGSLLHLQRLKKATFYDINDRLVQLERLMEDANTQSLDGNSSLEEIGNDLHKVHKLLREMHGIE